MVDERIRAVLANTVSIEDLQGMLSPAEIEDDDGAEAYKIFIEDVHNAETANMWFLLREALKSEARRSNVIQEIIVLKNSAMVRGLDAEMQEKLQDENTSRNVIRDVYNHLNTSFDGDGTRAKFDEQIQAIIEQTRQQHP